SPWWSGCAWAGPVGRRCWQKRQKHRRASCWSIQSTTNTSPVWSREIGNEKTASREGGGHREIGRWISASRCVPSGEREARDGGRYGTAAQVETAAVTAAPHGSLGVRR